MHCTVRRPMALPRSSGDHGALSPSIAHRPACCLCQQPAARPAVVLQTPASRRLAAQACPRLCAHAAPESAMLLNIYPASWVQLCPQVPTRFDGTAPLALIFLPQDPTLLRGPCNRTSSKRFSGLLDSPPSS